LTDIASSIGLHQLRKAEEFRIQREKVARRYFEGLKNVDEIILPPDDKTE